MPKQYKIHEIARISGVTVRTLHHYDQIDLLKPDETSPAGYRLYSDKNLADLEQIRFFCELDFTLSEIKRILHSPGFDRLGAYRMHKRLLEAKAKRLDDILTSLNKTIQNTEKGEKTNMADTFKALSKKEIEQVQAQYEDEVRRKYPKEQVEQSNKRVKGYTDEKWAEIQQRGHEINLKLVAAMPQGPASSAAQEGVAAWRQFITESYYDCTPEIFKGLGELYVTDERFTAFYEKYAQGLAQFLHETIDVYCDNLKK